MPKQVQKTKISQMIQGTKIPVANNSKCLFSEVNLNSTRSKETKIKYPSTPISSRNNDQPIRFQKLQFPIASKQTRPTFSLNIDVGLNFNFTSSINSGSVVDNTVAPTAPYIFGSTSPKGNTSNDPSARPSLTKLSSNVHQGSNVDVECITEPLSDSRLVRHQNMFKSRYAIKNRCDKGYVGGIRINRRFDLLMQYREEQLAVIRETI